MRTELFNMPWLNRQRPQAALPDETVALNPDEHLSLKIDNVRDFFANRRLPSLHLSMLSRGSKCAIVAGGDSMWECETFDGDIIACGSAYAPLVNKGVLPRYAVFYDPLPQQSLYLKNPHGGCCHLVASMCHPSVFDALNGYRVIAWHAAGDVPHQEYHYEPVVGGGSMVALRALPLACIIGYRDTHFFGLDSSFDDETQHGYDIRSFGDHVPMPQEIYYEGFRTTYQLVCQAQQFMTMEELHGDKFKATVHGDGLLAWERRRRGVPA